MKDSATKKWLSYVLIGCGALFFLVVAGLEYLAIINVDPKISQFTGLQQTYLDDYLEDQSFLLTQTVLFAKSSGTVDAGTILNSRLKWRPNISNTPPPTPFVKPEVRELILRDGKTWIEHLSRYQKLQIDFSLLEELGKFDHWNIESSGPLHMLTEQGLFFPPDQLPVPEILDLSVLAKLRLIHAAKRLDPLVALQEVRKLASLMLSTENLNIMLSGLSILDIERRAYSFYVERGILKPEAWLPVDRNVTRRANRVLWAQEGYLHVWTPISILQKVFLDEADLSFGNCAAINQGYPRAMMFAPLLEERWPLERDYKRSFRQFEAIFKKAQQGCRMSYIGKIATLKSFKYDFPLPFLLTAIPYSRKLFGLKLSTLGISGFDGYAPPDKTHPSN